MQDLPKKANVCAFQMEGVHEDLMAGALVGFAQNGATVVALPTARIVKSRGDFFSTVSHRDVFVEYTEVESRSDWHALADRVRFLDPDVLFFNTFQRDGVATFARQFDRPIVGVVHNPHLFTGSEECMSLLKEGRLNILGLAHHVVDYMRAALPDYEDQIHLYLPYFWMHDQDDGFVLPDEGDPLSIVLPGAIDYENRDFEGLVAYLASSRITLPRPVQFSIVAGGPNRKDLEQAVEENGLQDWFDFLPLNPETRRVPHQDYLQRIYRCHAMMALLPVGRTDYLKTKITTGIPAAIGVGRPIAAPRSVADVYGFTPIHVAEMYPYDLSKADLSNFALQRLRDEAMRLRSNGLHHNTTLFKGLYCKPCSA